MPGHRCHPGRHGAWRFRASPGAPAAGLGPATAWGRSALCQQWTKTKRTQFSLCPVGQLGGAALDWMFTSPRIRMFNPKSQ